MPYNKHTPSLLCAVSAVALFASVAMAEAPHEHHGHKGHDIHWGYDGKTGPHHWGKLKKDFRVCQTGGLQSPVNIVPSAHAGLTPLKIGYAAAPLTIGNNGHTIQVDYPTGSTLEIDGRKYDLLQFHFHTPSEYAINGKRYDMEVHFVHKDNKGNLGVVGIMIEEGKENAAVANIWKNLPVNEGDKKTHDGITVNAADFFPQDKSHYLLTGSLTTPPCTEGVRWHVLKTPIQFSKEQIQKFRSIFPMNARPIQHSHHRFVLDKS